VTRLFGRSQPQRPSTPASAVKTTPYQGSGNTSSGISETLPPLYRHVASLVPTRVASLFGVAAIQLCVASLALVPCLGREFASYEFVPDGGEYSLSVDILRGGFGLQGQANLAGWLTQTFLLLATGTALILRSIHRNRSDTSKPGVRLWGTLAIVWTSASLATTLPIGPAVAAALLQMTNTPFGPQGLGWWVSLGSFCISITVFATFFRLRERLASLIALTPGLLLWCASTACVWFSVKDPRLLLLANATWLAGSGCISFAMILAVRSSLREIDGLCSPWKSREKLDLSPQLQHPFPRMTHGRRQRQPLTLKRFQITSPQAGTQYVTMVQSIVTSMQVMTKLLCNAVYQSLNAVDFANSRGTGGLLSGPLTKRPRFPIVTAEVTRESTNSFCAKPDWLSSHRRRPYRIIQLAVCSTPRWQIYFADR